MSSSTTSNPSSAKPKASKASSSSASSSSSSYSKVVALPSMTHSLQFLPHMESVDPRCLHFGGLGASKEASQAKLQQALQRRDTASTYNGASSNSHQPVLFYSAPPRKSSGGDDGDYLMMNKGRKKPA